MFQLDVGKRKDLGKGQERQFYLIRYLKFEVKHKASLRRYKVYQKLIMCVIDLIVFSVFSYMVESLNT